MFFTAEQKEQRQLALDLLEETIPLIHERKLSEALDLSKRAKEIFEEIGDSRQVATALNYSSIIYAEMGNDTLDMEALLDALDICIDEEAFDIAAKLYNNIASHFLKVKDFEHALFYLNLSSEAFEKALKAKLTNKKECTYLLTILEANLAYAYSCTGDMKQSRAHFNKAKERVNKSDEDDLKFIFSSFEGTILWRLGEKDAARKLSEQILETADNTPYTTDYMEVMSYLIALLTEMKDYPNLKKAIKILEDHHQEDEGQFRRLDILNYWAEYYKAIGDEEKYKEICIKYYETSREKVAYDNQRIATQIEMKAEMRRAIREKKKTDSIVYIDSLTQIGNRNKMLEDSKDYIEEAIKNSTTIAIGLIDIDFFKECNDTYGHIEGDNCLKLVAKTISGAVGDSGSVYRYGGDEFVVLLPNVTEEDIERIGSSIKNVLETLYIPNAKSPISKYVTISQGYTMACPDEGDTIDTLVNLADKALYTVKRNGRNSYRYITFADIVAGIY